MIKDKKVVALGGGTGLSTILRGIKKHTPNITAIVTVSDNGGSSGMIREEMNLIPPGDIRNCIVALANAEPEMKQLLQYRFNEGNLKGQNVGNLLLAALTDLSGNFEKAVKLISNVLAITGEVLPVTLENVTLVGTFENGVCVEGETQIVAYGKEEKHLIKEIVLEPKGAKPPEDVIRAIREADVITLGPGSLYTSIIPNLLVEGVAEAISQSKAKKIYIANMMTQPGETTGFSIEEHISVLEDYVGNETVDYVIVNNEPIEREYLERYIEEGADALVKNDEDAIWQRIKCIELPLVKINHEKEYIRHDSDKLAEYIISL